MIMAEYIDRTKCFTIINNYRKSVDDKGKVVVDAILDIVAIICPTADVAPVVHGKWIIETIKSNFYLFDDSYIVKCSECGYIRYSSGTGGFNTDNFPDICEKCGARMNGERRMH